MLYYVNVALIVAAPFNFALFPLALFNVVLSTVALFNGAVSLFVSLFDVALFNDEFYPFT